MTKYAAFQKIISILVIINLIGCTSLQPIKAQPAELQDRIRHEDLVKTLDNVRIFTKDGSEYLLLVTHIDAKNIVGVQVTSSEGEKVLGDRVTVTVDSIVGLETEEVSIGETAKATGGLLAKGVFSMGFLLVGVLLLFGPLMLLSG